MLLCPHLSAISEQCTVSRPSDLQMIHLTNAICDDCFHTFHERCRFVTGKLPSRMPGEACISISLHAERRMYFRMNSLGFAICARIKAAHVDGDDLDSTKMVHSESHRDYQVAQQHSLLRKLPGISTNFG